MSVDRIVGLVPAALTEFLLGATEEERRALGPQLEAWVKAAGQQWWEFPDDLAVSVALAAVGCLPSAARTAALLGRRGMRESWPQIPVRHFLAIAEARSLPWLDDLALRLAGRLPAAETWTDSWSFVAALLQASGTAPPVTEAVVRSWLFSVYLAVDPATRVPLADRLRTDPHLDVLLPGVFTVDGTGAHLNAPYWDPAGGTWQTVPEFPSAVARLVAEGRLNRRHILAATVERLVRGDRPAWLRPFALLHEELAPTVDELAGHTLEYTRLLPDAPSPIAGLAQRALRRLDDAGRLELETLLEASHPALLRKEKTLVKAHLTWLDKVARREPARTAEILAVVTTAFDHPALDIQERALTLIARHATRLDTGDLAALADATAGLSADLRARAATIFGTAPEPAPEPLAELPPPPPSPAMPPPIGSPAELAEEVVALLTDGTATRWERVLAAVVALPRDGFAERLAPVLDRHRDAFADHRWNDRRLVLLAETLRGVISPQQRGTAWHRMIAAVKDLRQHRASLIRTPDGVLEHRIAELAVRLATAPVPELLATPTHVNGSLDPGTLLERLLRAEAQGRQPWDADLEQALLRLPRDTDDTVLRRATTLTSPAGRRFAAWLASGGLPDPVSVRFEQRPAAPSGPIEIIQVTNLRVMVNLTPARPTGLSLEPHLLTLTRRPAPNYYAAEFTGEVTLLAAVLPHHREVAAAWALPVLARLADQDERGGAELLPLLAECTGPLGPAMSLALAYVLGARHETDRVASVDAFLALTPTDPAYATAVGTDLGALAAGGTVKLTRAVPALADAHRAGATRAVWHLLTAALPLVLPAAPRGLPDLLELSTQVASAAGVRGQVVDGLGEVAARAGSSRLVREAKRLQTTLSA